MTYQDAWKMIDAKRECIVRMTSGTGKDCIRGDCMECDINYAQGNMGQQKEALRMASQALKYVYKHEINTLD